MVRTQGRFGRISKVYIERINDKPTKKIGHHNETHEAVKRATIYNNSEHIAYKP